MTGTDHSDGASLARAKKSRPFDVKNYLTTPEMAAAYEAERRSGQVTEPSAQHTEPQREPDSYSEVMKRYHLDRNYGMED